MRTKILAAGVGSALLLAMSAVQAAAEIRPMAPGAGHASTSPMLTPVAQKGHGGGMGGGLGGGIRMGGGGPKIHMGGGHIGGGPKLRMAPSHSPGGLALKHSGPGFKPGIGPRPGGWNGKGIRHAGRHHKHHRRYPYFYPYIYSYGYPAYSYSYSYADDDDDCYWSRRYRRWVCPDEE